MLKSIVVVCLLVTLTACKYVESNSYNMEKLAGRWTVLHILYGKPTVAAFCGGNPTQINFYEDEAGFQMMFDKDKEDVKYGILKSEQIGDTVFLTTDSVQEGERMIYRFQWIDSARQMGLLVNSDQFGNFDSFLIIPEAREKEYKFVRTSCKECYTKCVDTLPPTPLYQIRAITIGYISRYEMFGEHEDTDSNMADVKHYLSIMEPLQDDDELQALISIWLHYHPLGFNTRTYVLPVLLKSRPASLTAVANRIKDTPADSRAELADLQILLKQLKVN